MFPKEQKKIRIRETLNLLTNADSSTHTIFFFFCGGGANDRPGPDHLTSGPMRGLKKTAPSGANTQTDGHTSGHGDSMTESANWGQFSEKQLLMDLGSLKLCFWHTQKCENCLSCMHFSNLWVSQKVDLWQPISVSETNLQQILMPH